MSTDNTAPSRTTTAVWHRQDFGGGLVIIGVAIFAFWQASDLPVGTLGGMGPGMLPRFLALLLGLLGALLLVDSILEAGPPLGWWSVRGPLLVLGGVVVFGLTVRPLGLLVAGPAAIVVAAFASDEVRWKETLPFGALMTAFCIGLFKFALGLPIPLAPWLLGY